MSEESASAKGAKAEGKLGRRRESSPVLPSLDVTDRRGTARSLGLPLHLIHNTYNNVLLKHCKRTTSSGTIYNYYQEKSVSRLWANGPQATTAFSPKGPCPAGFSRSSGHMRALKINVPNTTYIATVTFGDQKQDKVSWYMRSV